MESNGRSRLSKFFCCLLICIFLAACGAAPASEGKCGDGVCDEAEQKDPKLCPEDCQQVGGLGAAPAVDDSTGNEKWKATVTWDCDADLGGGNFDRWSVKMEYDFEVDSKGQISGSGSGTPSRLYCERKGCTCEMTMQDFNVQVGGLKQGDVFSLEVKPTSNLTVTVTCPGVSAQSGTVYQMESCTSIGNPLDVTIDAQDGAIRSFEGQPDGFPGGITHGNTVITKQ